MGPPHMNPIRFLSFCFVALAWYPGVAQSAPSLAQADKVHTLRMQKHVAKVARKVAVPVGSLNADDDFRGFEVLASRLPQARLLGLGESTHGTHEFNQFRAKLFRYLVLHQGYTHFLLEDMLFATVPLENYIQGLGTDDPKGTMTGLMWTWCTEDMVEFLRWARAYNTNLRDDARKVHIVGIDIQKPYRQAVYLLDRMRKAHLSAESVDVMASIAEGMPQADALNFNELAGQQNDPATPGRWRRARAGLAALELRLGETVQPELRTLLQAIICGVDLEIAPGEDSIRDRGMAMQILDLLKRVPSGSKAIWWAHNSHVSGGTPERFPWAGTFLRSRLGAQYAVVGCFTEEGTLTSKDGRIVRQYENPDGTFKPGMPNVAPGPMAFRFPDGFLEGILARGLDQGIVFMDDLRKDAACQAFLSTRFIECSAVGSPFDPALTPDDRTPFQPDAFDAFFFIKRSNAAANVRFPVESKMPH